MSEAKEKFVQACRDRRDELRSEIEERERTIEKIEQMVGPDVDDEGEDPSPPKPRGRKATPSKSTGKKVSSDLADRTAVILNKKGPTELNLIPALLEAKGFRFKGKNKKQAVYMVMRNDDRFESVSRGVWGLKK